MAKYIFSVCVKRFDFLDQSSVDFINILHAAFWPKVYYTDFKCFQFGFVIFKQKGIGAKAACKMFMKLTTVRRHEALYFHQRLAIVSNWGNCSTDWVAQVKSKADQTRLTRIIVLMAFYLFVFNCCVTNLSLFELYVTIKMPLWYRENNNNNMLSKSNRSIGKLLDLSMSRIMNHLIEIYGFCDFW